MSFLDQAKGILSRKVFLQSTETLLLARGVRGGQECFIAELHDHIWGGGLRQERIRIGVHPVGNPKDTPESVAEALAVSIFAAKPEERA